jgi:thermitase
MKWIFKINRKVVTWEISETLVAIPPPPDFKPRIIDDEFPETLGKAASNGGGYYYKRSIPDQEIFERTGWRFISPAQSGNEKDVRQVYFSESGDLLIETKLATVQLVAEHCYTNRTSPEKILAEDDLEIVYRLSFAPNLYAVRILSQRTLPDTIEVLQKKTDRYVFAEPSVLQRVSGRETPSDPDYFDQWQHADALKLDGTGGLGLHSEEAWAITTGVGDNGPVRVAVIDNGMDINHTDLKDAIKSGGFFRPDAPGSGTATFVRFQKGMTGFPVRGHGTFCLGMVGAKKDNQNGGCGIAPDADLVAVACAVDQTGTQLTLARAIEFAVNPQAVDPGGPTTAGADVISCSLRTANVVESVLELALNSAAAGRGGLGVPIFWAVSNDSTPISDDQLCSLDNVIAVGRANRTGAPGGSASGPKLEFIAPGVDVFGPSRGSQNVVSTGTSFATPLAAGVAALVISLHPDWTADEVRQHLRDTCDKPNGDGHDDAFGFGRLNAANAVQPIVNAQGVG